MEYWVWVQFCSLRPPIFLPSYSTATNPPRTLYPAHTLFFGLLATQKTVSRYVSWVCRKQAHCQSDGYLELGFIPTEGGHFLRVRGGRLRWGCSLLIISIFQATNRGIMIRSRVCHLRRPLRTQKGGKGLPSPGYCLAERRPLLPQTEVTLGSGILEGALTNCPSCSAFLFGNSDKDFTMQSVTRKFKLHTKEKQDTLTKKLTPGLYYAAMLYPMPVLLSIKNVSRRDPQAPILPVRCVWRRQCLMCGLGLCQPDHR